MITSYKDIQKIIQQKQQPSEQITDLDLSSVKIFRFTEKIKLLIQKCQMLAILNLSQCELNSLDKLPNLPGLVALDLSGNKLKDIDLINLTKYPNLSILNLSDNFIEHLNSIQSLKKLTKLKDLQLAGNQIQKEQQYREQIFRQQQFIINERIKGLELLDKLDCQKQPPAYDSYSDYQSSEQEDSDQDGMDYFDQQQSQSGEGEGDQNCNNKSEGQNLLQQRKNKKLQNANLFRHKKHHKQQ